MSDYLTEILNIKVSYWSLNGHKKDTKDSLIYEFNIIATQDSTTGKWTTYTNNSLDALFERNKIKYPLLVPYNLVGEKRKILINCSKRTQFCDTTIIKWN
jgi:hypothetical protein